MNINNKSLFKQQCYINGKWVSAESNETIEVNNPATNEVIGSTPKLSTNETKHAIESAGKALKDWKNKTAKERSIILRNWYDLMLLNQNDLAHIMTIEQGKPLSESKGEILYGSSFVEWFAEEGKRIYGDTIPEHQSDKRIIVIKQPVGVVAAITPWNFPNAMITRKCAPALAAGCTVVVKPASMTPYSALALGELAEKAGIPPGVFNVITGNAQEIGNELSSNPIVKKLSFTGSTEVGKVLIRNCAGTVKKVSMELGGNAPFIVFNDANLDEAVNGAIMSKFRNTGQTCVCANRIYAQAGIYDDFVRKLTNEVKKLKVGNGLEDGITQGPLINEQALKKVEEHLKDALSKGAKIEIGGKRHALSGTFFEPTVLSKVSKKMKVAEEETFGPLAPVFKFTDEQDVIEQANSSEFGLAAYFYARDIGLIWRVAEKIESGIVGVNTGIISTEVAPFGGVKESGVGREGSRYGIEEFLEIKYICLGGIND